MPSSYAHYRFGRLALPDLPEDTRRTVQRFRQLYDVGQHGPDLFFYGQAFFPSRLGDLGHLYHGMTGVDFFSSAAEQLREHPSEGGESYLFGVLGHFALDSACHPMVRAAAEAGKAGRTELETEFDRTLLTLDGEESPQTANISGHMRLTWGECVTAAEFYPPATAYTIRQDVALMALINRAQAMRNRALVERMFRLAHQQEMVMYSRPNHKCAALVEELHGKFDQALKNYASMALQLHQCIHGDAQLGEAFETTFG